MLSELLDETIASFTLTGDKLYRLRWSRRYCRRCSIFRHQGEREAAVHFGNVDLLSDGRDTAVLLFDPREFGAGEYELSNRQVAGFGGTAGLR